MILVLLLRWQISDISMTRFCDSDYNFLLVWYVFLLVWYRFLLFRWHSSAMFIFSDDPFLLFRYLFLLLWWHISVIPMTHFMFVFSDDPFLLCWYLFLLCWWYISVTSMTYLCYFEDSLLFIIAILMTHVCCRTSLSAHALWSLMPTRPYCLGPLAGIICTYIYKDIYKKKYIYIYIYTAVSFFCFLF